MAIRAIIFDLDGVLVDSEPYYQVEREKYLRSFGVTLTREQSLRFTGLRFLTAMEDLRPSISANVYQEIIENFVPWEIDFSQYIRKEAFDVLKKLRQAGYKTAIASNSTPQKITKLLTDCNLGELIDVVCSGAEVGHGKPDPDIYLETCRRLCIPCQECVAVEDSDHGLYAARMAGCGVLCLVDRRFQFQQTEADVWIQELRDVPSAIAAWKN